jgi:hypothetical protein
MKTVAAAPLVAVPWHETPRQGALMASSQEGAGVLATCGLGPFSRVTAKVFLVICQARTECTQGSCTCIESLQKDAIAASKY